MGDEVKFRKNIERFRDMFCDSGVVIGKNRKNAQSPAIRRAFLRWGEVVKGGNITREHSLRQRLLFGDLAVLVHVKNTKTLRKQNVGLSLLLRRKAKLSKGC